MHYHVMVVEPGSNGRPSLRKGALCLTEDAARNEAGIELSTSADRKATIERCHRNCFGSSRVA